MFRRNVECGLLALILFAATPAVAETWFEAAWRHLERGHVPEARRMLEREIKVRPRNLDARYDLAVLLERMGHEQEAQRLYQENLKKGWHLPTVVNLTAMWRRHGRIADAETLLERAATHFRHEAAPWYLLAELAESQGRFQEAETDYRKAVRADPLNGYARIRLARFLSNRHRGNEAVAEAERALELAPDCAPCLVIAGDIFQTHHDLRRALAAWQKAEAIEPRRDTRRRIIGALVALGKTQEAAVMQRALTAETERIQP